MEPIVKSLDGAYLYGHERIVWPAAGDVPEWDVELSKRAGHLGNEVFAVDAKVSGVSFY